MLKRFASNHLGLAPGEFPTYERRRNRRLTIFPYAESIPKLSEAPPALDPVESKCSRSVGSWDGSSLKPWRRPQPAANLHPRPPFTTMAATAALSHAPGRLLGVPGACSQLRSAPALVSPPPPLLFARRRPPSTTACNSHAMRPRGEETPLGSVQGTLPRG